MLAWTHTTLVTALKDQLSNQSTDFDEHVDEMIGLGEIKIVKDLDLEIFDSVEDLAFVINVATVAKPTDAIAIRSPYHVTAGGVRSLLLSRSREYLDDYWPNPTLTGTPKYWCEHGESTIRVAPTPAATLTGKAVCIKRPTGMTAANPTTWFGTNAPDTLFYATLLMASRFEMADERMALWSAAYEDSLDRTKVDLRSILRKDYATVTGTSEAEGER
jgi:hypothetical protein